MSTHSGEWRGAAVLYLAFFAAFALYVWTRVEPRVWYETSPAFPVFSSSASFLMAHLGQLGGPAEWAAAGLAQCYFVTWLGVLAIAATTSMLSAGTALYLARTTGRGAPLASLVPALAVLHLYGRCSYHLQSVLVVAVATLASAVYVRFAPRQPAARLWAFTCLLATLCYALAGGCVLFAVLCGLHEFASRRSVPLGAVCLVAALGLPLVGRLWWPAWSAPQVLGSVLAFRSHGSSAAMATVACLQLFTPVATLALVAARFGRPASLLRLAEHASRVAGGVRPGIRSLALVVAAFAPLALTHDAERLTRQRLDSAALNRDWQRVLQAATDLPYGYYDDSVLHNVNRALYHLDRLPSDMFAFPQTLDGLVLGANHVDERGAPQRVRATSFPYYLQTCGVFLELGLTNEAEHRAHEALEMLGEHATTLKHLARINLVKGQFAAAGQFLSALRQRPFRGEEASDYLGRLEAGPTALGEGFARAQSLTLQTDLETGGIPLERGLEALLAQNPQNRMACEYLMALYLLKRQPDKVAANLTRLQPLGYAALPRHYEEALLVHQTVSGEKVDLLGYSISAASRGRFAHFTQLLTRLAATPTDESAAHELASVHGDTYFYYHQFGRSGGLR